jgi:heme exporter protein B
MWHDAVLIAGRDLRVEWRSRVATNQVAPLALVILLLFAFALDPARGVLERAAAGLFWVAVVLCALLIVQRAATLESTEGVRDALRLTALAPSGVFLGKVVAVGVELLALEVLLTAGVAVFYGVGMSGWPLVVATAVLATASIAGAGTLYAVLAAGLRVRDTLLPLLLLPVLAPVLIGATRAYEAAFAEVPSEGWPWLGLLGVFALVYIVIGALAYGPLLEET